MRTVSEPRRGWNPNRLGIKRTRSGATTDTWLYLTGRTLEIVTQISDGKIVLGTTVQIVRLPPRFRPT